MCGQARRDPSPNRRAIPNVRAVVSATFVFLERSHRAPVSLCGRHAVQIHDRGRPLDLDRLKAKLAPLGSVRSNDFALRFDLPPYEMTIFPDGRAIIKGTTDVAPGSAASIPATSETKLLCDGLWTVAPFKPGF